ncbi:MAG: hypothetical protein L6R40_007511 [Gallowayella cf. fulva]|nr:MAG: hypothetical protein L6R40_007511 [Xanthomendoza cf. fulva]
MRFSFPVLVLLATSLSTAYEVPEKRNYDNKPVYAGKYAIYDCNSNASIVKQDLDSLWDILQLVLADLNAPATGAAFDTFFKEKRNKGFVKKVLQNVADGAAVRKSGRHRGYDSQSPLPTEPSAIAIYQTANPNIALCDPYWSPSFLTAPPLGACYRTRRKDHVVFSRDGDDIAQSRIYTLLHEAVHYYVEAASQQTLNPDLDTYRISQSYALSADEAIYNTGAYMFYVYGELPSSLIVLFDTCCL